MDSTVTTALGIATEHGVLATSGILGTSGMLAASDVAAWLLFFWQLAKVLVGFSLIIFVHELGHFLAAKWCGVRVDRFAVGFGTRLFGWRKGEGLTFGNRPSLPPAEFATRGWGETDYCLKALPLGGYVKMLGEHDFDFDEKTGEVRMSKDPRAFTNKPVRQRMLVASAGVVFNLLFAAVAYMGVFMMGIKAPAPLIGEVEPNSPADRAGLRPGDRVLAINGKKVDFWMDLDVRAAISTKPFALTIERDKQTLPEPIVVASVYDEDLKHPVIGVIPAIQIIAGNEWPAPPGKPGVQFRDRVIGVGGQPLENGSDLFAVLARAKEVSEIPITVERLRDTQAKGRDGPADEVAVHTALELQLDGPEPPVDRRTDRTAPPPHVLGFAPRVMISILSENRPGQRGGIRVGDVIERAGPLLAPSRGDLLSLIAESQRQAILFTLIRGDEVVQTTITPEPKERYKPFGDKSPHLGIGLDGVEQEQVYIARVVPGTAAAEAGVPPHSRVTAMNGEPVRSWRDFLLKLSARAGTRVELTLSLDRQTLSLPFNVPSSIYNELQMPPDVRVLSVNGKKNVETAEGRQLSVSSVPGLAEALRQNKGQRVTVAFAADLGRAPPLTRDFNVTADNYLPWQLQFSNSIGWQARSQNLRVTDFVSAGGNPWRALLMGLRYTTQWVTTTYQSMRQVATQNVSTDNLSGPIGIFSVLVETADQGMAQLIFMFAMLSVNLAVINFLPLPVMDGGLMLFLIIERIRGKPLSMKTQMISTMVGIGVIALVFIVVTIQDISRLLP